MTPFVDRRTFLKGVGAVAVSVACGGASATGTISVYSALNESTNNQFFAAFKTANPGVTVNVLGLAAAGELQTRIRTEKASPKADIFIGGSSEFHDPLGKEGLLEAYIAPNAKDIAAQFKEASGLWTGWYTGIFGFISNTSRLSEVGGKKPATWDDLLDPAWKGKLALPDPIKTGGGYIFIATQIFRFNRDEAKAMDFMKKLHANIGGNYIGTSPLAISNVSEGKVVGAPNWSHDILTEKGKNPGVELTVPADTGFEVGAVSIVKGTKSLAAAQALVNWSITKEAGDLNVKLSNRGSTRTDVAPAAGAPSLTSVKLVNYDRQWATDNKDRILKLWQTTVGL
jgi:iron(III) transport system substrate-binding protein